MLSDSDTEDIHTLTINEHYAKAFEYKKEREEFAKLKDKYGSDADEDDSEDSEDETEDEDAEELTPAVDAAIFRTLARIKRKDPEIYKSEKSIFEEEQERTVAKNPSSRARKDKSKPITMRQVALESALNQTSRSPSPEPLPHVEEQRALRSETIAAFRGAADEEEDDDLLIPREKSKDEIEKEEEEYREFLAREVGEDLEKLVVIEEGAINARESEQGEHKEEGKKSKKKSKDKGKGKAKQETEQEFLMNYILNRGWIDRSANRIPTYQEITGSKRSEDKTESDDDEGDAAERPGDDIINQSDDEEFEEIAERFESSYNFRFEEPDAAVIKGYPRNLPSVVRREDSSRKEARERKKQRKEEELTKKREEVKRLKSLKMKELRMKLERIGREGGKNLDETKALQDLDLEGDWDPDAHDQQMAGLYGDDSIGDVEKPEWDDDIDIADIALDEDLTSKKKKKKRKKAKEVDGADEGVDIDAMDADVERIDDDEEWDGTEEMRKRKLDEYMNEIYGLDFNDIVGDMPTRFKYTPVQAQSFALTPAEILMATDAELNQYLSVKKYAPYRKDNKWDKTRGDRLKELKQSVVERSKSTYGMDGGDANGEKTKKRKGKKERQKMKATDAETGIVLENDLSIGAAIQSASHRKRKHEDIGDVDEELEQGQGQAQEHTCSSKRKRKRRKKTVQE